MDQKPKDRNLTWHDRSVTREDLAKLNGHQAVTVWLTGLSASGKSTLANATARTLYELGVRTHVLDGDNVRHGLNKDLGFSPDDRAENIRRIGELAKLYTDAGLVNFTAFISPYRVDRDNSRALQPDDFIEVHVDCSLEVCEERDPKGIYKKARDGLIKDFTGVSAPYESPERPEVYLNTATTSIEDCVKTIVAALVDRGVIMPVTSKDKARLRAEILEDFTSVPEPDRHAWSVAIAKTVLALPELKRTSSLMLFLSKDDELDMDPLISGALDAGLTVYGPCTLSRSRRLVPTRLTSLEAVSAGAYGIREPACEETLDPGDLDIVIVPAVAFDRRGYRLGRGGGYYDRFLELLSPGAMTCGVIASRHLQSHVPTEPHDRKVRMIVTENEVLQT